MVFVPLAAGLIIWQSNRVEPEVKGLISPTVIITPTASVSAEATVSSTPKPTKKPTPVLTPTPTAETPETIYGLVERFASQYGVDPNVIRYIAICESGFRSNAINGPYAGLFQFNSVTWGIIRMEMGEDTNPDLRFSAEESVQTAAYALSKSKGKIWPNCMP